MTCLSWTCCTRCTMADLDHHVECPVVHCRAPYLRTNGTSSIGKPKRRGGGRAAHSSCCRLTRRSTSSKVQVASKSGGRTSSPPLHRFDSRWLGARNTINMLTAPLTAAHCRSAACGGPVCSSRIMVAGGRLSFCVLHDSVAFSLFSQRP